MWCHYLIHEWCHPFLFTIPKIYSLSYINHHFPLFNNNHQPLIRRHNPKNISFVPTARPSPSSFGSHPQPLPEIPYNSYFQPLQSNKNSAKSLRKLQRKRQKVLIPFIPKHQTQPTCINSLRLNLNTIHQVSKELQAHTNKN